MFVSKLDKVTLPGYSDIKQPEWVFSSLFVWMAVTLRRETEIMLLSWKDYEDLCFFATLSLQTDYKVMDSAIYFVCG